MSKLLEGHARPIAHSFISTAIFEILYRGIPAAVTYYLAHQFSIRGWAWPWVILFAVIAFAALTIAFHFLRQNIRASAAKANGATGAVTSGKQAVCEDTDLHRFATGQAKNIGAWVYSDKPSFGRFDLMHPTAPWIDFEFDIRNTSVHLVSLRDVTGAIDIAGAPVSGQLQLTKPLLGLPSGTGHPNLEAQCVVRLTITNEKEVGRILNATNNFTFDNLAISVSGESIETGTVKIFYGLPNMKLKQEYPGLKATAQEVTVAEYWDRPKGGSLWDAELVGSVVNVRLEIYHVRNSTMVIERFKLRTGDANNPPRFSSAQHGDISRLPYLEDGMPKRDGSPLDNLNARSIHAEPQDRIVGWLQFIIRDVRPSELKGRGGIIFAIDSRTEEHEMHVSFPSTD